MALDVRAQKALIGRVLRDRWHLDALLGAGGMATVYAATHRNGSRGAIKLLHPEYAFETEIRTRLVREGYLVNRIKHRGIVRVIDDDVTEEGWPYLVMELLEGQTLKERWIASERRLPIDEALRIAEAVLDTLAAAHAENVVHRDVKPDNVFLTKDDEVRLLDFGIARFKEAAMEATQTGAMLGTPAFMAPEQALAHWDEVDARSDVFAVGATLWTVLTGRMVHAATTVPEALVAAATRPARPFATVMPHAPPALAALLDRALAFDPAARWQSATDMRDAITSLRAAGIDATQSSAETLAPSTSPLEVAHTEAAPTQRLAPAPMATPRRALSWIAPVVLICTGGIAAAAFAGWFGPDDTLPATPNDGAAATASATPLDGATATPEQVPSDTVPERDTPPVATAEVARPPAAPASAPRLPRPSASALPDFDQTAARGAIQAEAARAAGRCAIHAPTKSIAVVFAFTSDGRASTIRPAQIAANLPARTWCIINSMDKARIKVPPFGGFPSREITSGILVE